MMPTYPTRLYTCLRPSCVGVFTLLCSIMMIALLSCKARPDGTQYLGKWTLTTKGGLGYPKDCQVEIVQNGESFLLRDVTEDQSWHQVCGKYDGIYTLTPEQNLSGGSFMPTLSFDNSIGRVVVSRGGSLEYLRRP